MKAASINDVAKGPQVWLGHVGNQITTCSSRHKTTEERFPIPGASDGR